MKHPQKVQVYHSSQGPVWQAAIHWALQYGQNTVYLSLRQTQRQSAKVRETPSGQKCSIGPVQNAPQTKGHLGHQLYEALATGPAISSFFQEKRKAGLEFVM